MSQRTIEDLKNEIIKNHQDYSDKTLSKIVKRLNLLNGLGLYTISTVDMIPNTSNDLMEMDDDLSHLIAEQIILMSILLKRVAYATYNSTKPLFNYKHMKFVPLEDNKQLSMQLAKSVRESKQNYVKTMSNLAYKTKNASGQFVVNSPKRTYKQIINRVLTNLQHMNHTDFVKFNDNLTKKLIGSKLLTVLYDVNGRRSLHELDSFLDNLLENSMWSVKQDIYNYVGNLLGTDGVEISVHKRPAEDHAPVQGHQFTLEEFNKMQSNMTFQDVQGRYYSNFVRKIGTWNCRHIVYPIFIGFNNPKYTDEQLQNILDENKKGFILPSGKHLTLYQCSQYENYLKRKVNKLKSAKKLAKTYGNKELYDSISVDLFKAESEYKTFRKKYGSGFKNKILI